MTTERSITTDQTDKLTDYLRWAHGICSVLCCDSEDMSDDHRNAVSCAMHQIEDAQQILNELGGAS